MLPAVSGTRQGRVLVGIRLGGSPTLLDNNISLVCVPHFSTFKEKKKKNSQMPRHLISDVHEWIDEIPSVPISLTLLARVTKYRPDVSPAGRTRRLEGALSEDLRG